DHTAILGREKSRRQRDVLDVTAAQLELVRQEVQIYVPCHRRFNWPDAVPDAPPIHFVREREVDGEGQATHKGLVQILAQVGGHDSYPLVLFHLLQQIRNLDVRIAIVGVTYLRALAKQGIGLIEEENGIGIFGGGEDAVQILFGLTDVLADDAGQ